MKNLQKMSDIYSVPHPEYGHVIFDKPTIRQIQVLEKYNELMKGKIPSAYYPGVDVRHKISGKIGVIVDRNTTGFNHWTVEFEDGLDRVYQQDLEIL